METLNKDIEKPADFWHLFWVFFKIGAFTFGGGYAMIPLIRNEVVEKCHWIDDASFVEMLALAQSAPGPIALNTAIFVGNTKKGKRGSVVTSLGIILPSFIAILLIALVFTEFRTNPHVERVFKGIRPAVVALIAAPVWNLAKSAGVTWKTIWIPILACFLIAYVGLSPIYMVLAGIIGGIIYKLWKS